MSVVTSFEEAGPCKKRMTIEVPAEAVEAEMGRVISEFRRELRIPGFRQGKVPVSLVKNRFQKEIEKEVVDRLFPRYWHQAQAEKNFDPLLPPQVEELEIEAGKPMTLVASVETRPELELQDLDDFDLPTGEVEPSETEIEDALRDVRRQHAIWTPVDRPAANGDLVVGRMKGLDPDADEPQPLQIELGAQDADEQMTLALTGRTAGQKVDVPMPGEDGERKLEIEIEAVKEQELPELDGDLADKFGFESFEELHAALVRDLRRGKERGLRVKRQEAVLEQLRQRHPIELPAGVVERENQHMLEEYAEGLVRQGIDLERAPFDWDALARQLRPQAERRVHDRLLLDAVAVAEGLRVDESEFEQLLTRIAAQQGENSLSLRQKLADAGRLEPLRAQLLREQALRHLLGDGEENGDRAGTDPDDADDDATTESTKNA